MKKLLLGLILVCLLVSALGGTAGAEPSTLSSLATAVTCSGSGLFTPAWIISRDVSTPTCDAITPASGPNDRATSVTIAGTGFGTDGTGTIAPTVTLGTTALQNVTFVDATSLTAIVPAELVPGAYTLTVTNPDGGSASLADAFTVTPPPTVTVVDPVSAYNDIDAVVTITGANFAAVFDGALLLTSPTASLGTVPLVDVTFVDATTLTATVPWGMDPGVYDLTIVNPDGGTGSLAGAFTVTPGIGQWNTCALYGGAVGQILMKPGDPDTLYAVAYPGLFRSRDAGEHWSFISRFGYFQIDPLHPSWLYSVRYRSKDEGDTWTEVLHRSTEHYPDFDDIYPSPHDPQTLFISSCIGWDNITSASRADIAPRDTTAFGLIRSTDGGTTWKVVADLVGVPVSCVAYHPTDPLHMSLATNDEGRVFHSSDGGKHWSEVATPPISHIGVIAYNPYKSGEVWIASSALAPGPGGVCKSEDAAFTGWQDVRPGGTSAFVSFTSADSVYISGNHSTDGGLTWQSFGPWPTLSGALSIDPDDPQIGYAGDTTYGVQKTTDGGKTWEIKNQGLTGMVCGSMAISPADPLRVYAFLGWPGVHISSDGANSWTFIPVDGAGGAIRADPFDPQRVYTLGHNGLFTSTDGGRTWSDLGWNATPPSPAGVLSVLEPDPFQPGHLLVSLGTGFHLTGPAYLYSSSDYGVSWQPVTLPSSLTQIYDVAFDPATEGLVYLTSAASGVWRSTDSGGSWGRIDDPKQPDMAIAKFITIATHPRHVLFVEAAQAPFRSMDGGASWEQVPADSTTGRGTPGTGIIESVMFADGDSGRLYVATTSGLFFSSNVGDVWKRASGVFGRAHVTQLGYAVADGHTVIYAAKAGGDLGATGSAAAVTSRRAAAAASTLVAAGIYRCVVVTPKLTLKLSGLAGGALRLGKRVTAKGVVTPTGLAGSKVTLTVQRRQNGRWLKVTSLMRTIGASGTYSGTYKPAKKGSYRVLASIIKNATTMAARTPWRTFRVK